MKVTQMPPVHAANLVANSGNTAYGVDVIIVREMGKLHTHNPIEERQRLEVMWSWWTTKYNNLTFLKSCQLSAKFNIFIMWSAKFWYVVLSRSCEHLNSWTCMCAYSALVATDKAPGHLYSLCWWNSFVLGQFPTKILVLYLQLE